MRVTLTRAGSCWTAIDIVNATSSIFNPFGTTTPEFQSLMDTANASDAKDAFAPVNKYLVDQAWFAPLGYNTSYWVAAKDVKYTPPKVFAQNLLAWAPAK